MKLLVQGDDFGFTRGVTYGIVDSIDLGILRNTGLFTNMPSAELAVSYMKDRPHVCFGIDFNIVSGPSVSDPKTIPHLVDEQGEFIRSAVRVKDSAFQTEEGRRKLFPYEEVDREIHAQYNKFLELTGGKKPGYLHGHSLMHEHYMESIRALSKEVGVPFSMDLMEEKGFGSVMKAMRGERKAGPQKKEFDPIGQMNKDTIAQVLKYSDYLLGCEYAMIGGHPGYVDAELMGLTTLSLERMRDAQMCQSEVIKKWVEDNHIELITYYDLYEAK